MRNCSKYIVALACFTLIGCATNNTLGYDSWPTFQHYTPPEESGLVGLRPYPNRSDVCRIIGENDLTRSLLRDGFVLIGCPKHEHGAIKNIINSGAKVVFHAMHWSVFRIPNPTQDEGQSSEDKSRLPKSAAQLHELISNKTVVNWSEFHGTQIEYHDAQGDAWLVYPGNAHVLHGQWKVDFISDRLHICYRYYTSGINPATGVAGYDWECSPWSGDPTDTSFHYYDGDLFELYHRTSFPGSQELRQRKTLNELLALFGLQ